MSPYRAYLAGFSVVIVAIGLGAWLVNVPLVVVIIGVIAAFTAVMCVATNRARRAVPPPPPHTPPGPEIDPRAR